MAQQAKSLAAKPEGLSSIPEIYKMESRELIPGNCPDFHRHTQKSINQ